MEAVGFTASIISVATLVVNLADALKKAAEFWDSFEDAPADIRRISRELRLITNILDMIRRQHDTAVNLDIKDQWIKEALELAKQDVDELSQLVSKLSRLVGPENGRLKRQWGRLRFILKTDKIEKFKANIENVKGILTLLQTSQTQQSVCQVHGRLEILAANFQALSIEDSCQREISRDRDVSANIGTTEFKSTLNAPLESTPDAVVYPGSLQTRITQKSLDVGLGVLSLQSTTKTFKTSYNSALEKKGTKSTRQLFTIRFLCRFKSCRRGFRFHIDDTFDAWTFNTIRRRPWNSEIFQLCQIGDVQGVKMLLDCGGASVFDVDHHGDSPLHYACRHGHPDLARLLITYGADIYLTHDESRAAPTGLNYFASRGRNSFLSAPSVLDILIRHGNLNPFDYWPARETQVLPLQFDLPPALIEYLLSHKEDFDINIGRFIIFLEDLLIMGDASTKESQRSLCLLLTEYEERVSEMETKSHFPKYTLLQLLIKHWICNKLGSGFIVKNPVLKIRLVLKFTNDLLRWSLQGTALDTVLIHATGSKEHVLACSRKWLELLSSSSVNLRVYGQYEQQEHRGGIVAPPDFIKCCRNIHIEFAFGLSDNDLTISVRDERDSTYSHLDPAYMCEAGRRRGNCLSQMDATHIKDGKPLASIPGSWLETPRPNVELELVHRGLYGWVYVDQVEEFDILWYDGWEKAWEDTFDETDCYENDDELGDNHTSDDDVRSGDDDDEVGHDSEEHDDDGMSDDDDEVSHDSEENDVGEMSDDYKVQSNDKASDDNQ